MPSAREIRLYYFTAAEAAEMLCCGAEFVQRKAGSIGGVRWRNGGRIRIMIPPGAIAPLRAIYQMSRRKKYGR